MQTPTRWRDASPMIRISMAIIALCLAGSLAAAQETGPRYELTVAIDNQRSRNGVFRVSLFDGAPGFPNHPEQAFRRVRVDANETPPVATFTDLPSGWYAVAIIHDENTNGILDQGIFGIPLEGYAASNGAAGFLGYPSFESARFNVAGDTIMHITCK
jgi:uncharacterized protein (DUF2141 family)